MKIKWTPTEWKSNAVSINEVKIHTTESDDYKGIKFAVRTNSGFCLNKKGLWEYEPSPSNRDKKFYNRCRFNTFTEAVKRANKVLERK